MNPAAFVSELQRVSTELSAGRPGEIPDVRVPASWTVQTGDERIEVPALWLRRALENSRRNPSTWPAQRTRLLSQLDALTQEVKAASLRNRDEHTPSASAARDTLTTILSRSEFRQMHRQSALERLRQRVSQWLMDVWDRLGGTALGRRGTAIAFAWLAVIATLMVLATWIVRTIVRPSRTKRFALAAAGAQRPSARVWAREAATAADLRDAVRFAYRATVCGLEEEGVWRSDDTRTPREYLRLLPADHRRRTPVSDVARRFEEVWFAARDATEDDRKAMLGRLKELGCLPAE